MSWLTATMFEPSVPAHCEPTNDFLLRISATFHTCIPTPLACLSSTLGILSIIAWLFSQLPQIYKNWKISSTSGLSLFFLIQWGLGDLSNLLGATFTHQASWQVAIGSYYVFVDLCLVSQWLWYEKLRHGRTTLLLSREDARRSDVRSDIGMDQTVTERASPRFWSNRNPFQQRQAPLNIPNGDRNGHTDTTIHRIGTHSPLPSPSPRTLLLVVCLAALVRASPMTKPLDPPASGINSSATPLEHAGTILSWMSTFLYLGSRLPQLIKNWRRKSTAGLSPQLFAAAFCGNLFYSLALLTNPCAWFDFEPYGGRGWASAQGSERAKWVVAALPFFLGAAGVLGLDAGVGIQFLTYREGGSPFVVVEDQHGGGWRWRRLSGWMRGWIPSIGDGNNDERKALLGGSNRHGERYGTS